MRWRKFNGETIHLPIKDAVEEAIKKETSKGIHLKVCIGTDSQVKGNETEFATVIVFLREHNGGFMYIHNEKTKQQFNIKERMMLTWKYMLTLTQTLNSKVTTRFVKQWVTSWAWALHSKPSPKHLPAVAAQIKYAINYLNLPFRKIIQWQLKTAVKPCLPFSNFLLL